MILAVVCDELALVQVGYSQVTLPHQKNIKQRLIKVSVSSMALSEESVVVQWLAPRELSRVTS